MLNLHKGRRNKCEHKNNPDNSNDLFLEAVCPLDNLEVSL